MIKRLTLKTKIDFRQGTGTFILGWYLMILCLIIAVVLIDQYSKYDNALMTQMAVDSIADGSATYGATLTGVDDDEVEQKINEKANELSDYIVDETRIVEIYDYDYAIDVDDDKGSIDATIVTHTPNSYGNFAEIFEVDDGGLEYYPITRHTMTSFTRRTITQYATVSEAELSAEHIHYNQYDSRWATYPYGTSGTVASSGCGPTSFAMVVTELTGTAVTPDEAADFCYYRGYRVYGEGTAHAAFTVGVQSYGLQGQEIAKDEATMKSYLDYGALLIITVDPPSVYTGEGHCMVICDYNNIGFIINDPNYRAYKDYNVSMSYLINDGGLAHVFAIWKE